MVASVTGAVGLALLAAVSTATADAELITQRFLKRLQSGDVASAKRLLEGDKWRAKPSGGDDVYFAYESGQEPNFAFLIGRPFEIGPLSIREGRSDWYLLDGTVYTTVTAPLRFRADRYRPFLLPPPLAFGRAMAFVAFVGFTVAPEREHDAFTLRLRPSVEPGLIQPPGPRVAPPPPPPGPPGARPAGAVPSIGTTLGLPVARDPGSVVLPTGERLSPEQLTAFLPRLAAITLELQVTRRGRLAAWEISLFHFTSATIVTEKGEVVVGVFR